MDWEIHQMDVKAGFLNGVLEVEIYMDQLEGFIQKGKEHLMYKQSPIEYYHHIHSFFINEGFGKSQADY